MNVRLASSSVRFRISQKEVETLMKSQIIEESIILADGSLLAFKISVQEKSSGTEVKNLTFQKNCLHLAITEMDFEQLIHEAPAKEGISFKTYAPNGTTVKYSLQIDMAKTAKDT